MATSFPPSAAELRFTQAPESEAGLLSLGRSLDQSPRSEIGLLCTRHRKQIVSEVILVVLGADSFHQRIVHLAPALYQVQRLVERVGVGDLYQNLQRLAVGGGFEPLND